MTPECRQCHGRDLVEILDFGPQPIAHRLPDTADETEMLFPFALHFCNDCGLVQVLEPIDPEVLYTAYNYNFSSWKHEPHLEAELDSIMAAGPFSSVVEIGCNDGRFLAGLRERGVATAVGIEPNPVSSGIARERGFEVVNAMLTDEVCADVVGRHGRFDLLVTRQVTEHVPDLDRFFRGIRALLAEDGLLFLDVPDSGPAYALGDASVLWEEHVSYFTGAVLEDLLARQGFHCLRTDRYDFSGGSVAVLARRDDTAGPSGGAPADAETIRGYAPRLLAYRQRLRETLEAARRRGAKVVLYGVGVRGSVASNRLGLGDLIDFAVDDQAERQGRLMPGVKLPIRPSETLSEVETPVLCLLAVNNESEDKVMARARGQRNGRPIDFVSLCAPKDIWRELDALKAPAS